jgi:hypothetical protein
MMSPVNLMAAPPRTTAHADWVLSFGLWLARKPRKSGRREGGAGGAATAAEFSRIEAATSKRGGRLGRLRPFFQDYGARIAHWTKSFQ